MSVIIQTGSVGHSASAGIHLLGLGMYRIRIYKETNSSFSYKPNRKYEYSDSVAYKPNRGLKYSGYTYKKPNT